MQVRAKKNLGQHFLKDEEIARRISETISAEQLPAASAAYGSLPILEIGPGMGMMTKYLMNTGRELTAVELDHESVEYLDKIYPGLNVVEGDFLKMDRLPASSAALRIPEGSCAFSSHDRHRYPRPPPASPS